MVVGQLHDGWAAELRRQRQAVAAAALLGAAARVGRNPARVQAADDDNGPSNAVSQVRRREALCCVKPSLLAVRQCGTPADHAQECLG